MTISHLFVDVITGCAQCCVVLCCIQDYWKSSQYLQASYQLISSPFSGSPASWAPTLRGLLDRTTTRYVYKWLKASLHKPTGNLLEILFSKKCVFKNNLQLLEKNFLSQTNTTPKNGIFLNKMAHLLKSSIFQ